MTRAMELGPSRYAAQVVALTPMCTVMAKASGFLVHRGRELLLVTNWHVVTGGRRFYSPSERSDGTSKPVWEKNVLIESAPTALTVAAHIEGLLRPLDVLSLEERRTSPEGSVSIHRAWESEMSLFAGTFAEPIMPDRDVAVVRVTADVEKLLEDVAEREGVLFHPERFGAMGYNLDEMGEEHDLNIGDQVFVIGYPLTVGDRPQDPPVWTSGTVATDPHRGYDGSRFLIDARTRKGQSGSAVVAYHRGGRGLRPSWQLLGVYSGRIHPESDIGSVWLASALRESLVDPDDPLEHLSPPTFDPSVDPAAAWSAWHS